MSSLQGGPRRFPLRTPRFWGLVGLLVFLAWVISHRPVVEHIGLVLLDSAIGAQDDTPTDQLSTALILMTPDDRRELYGQRDSVFPQDLYALLEAADSAGAAVLAVDLLTHAKQYATTTPPSTRAPIVWSYGADAQTGDFLPPLGGRSDGPERAGLSIGVLDRDWRLRRYHPYWERPGFEPIPGFIRAIVDAWCTVTIRRDLRGCSGAGPDSTTARIFLSRRSLTVAAVSARELLVSYRERSLRPEAWQRSRSALLGRAVILGATGTVDAHSTGQGVVPGVLIVARGVESELRRSYILDMGEPTAMLLKVVLAVLIGLMFHYSSIGWATLLMGGLVGLTVFLGYNPALLRGYWLNAVPLLIGFWIEHVVEGYLAQRHREAERDGPRGRS